MRADAAFFDQKLLGFLEERQLPYVIVVRRNAGIERQARYLTDWTELDADTAVNEFTLQMRSWQQARRFIVVRLRLRDPREPRLLSVPGYELRVFVTNRTEQPQWLWQHYDQRAAIEPRFSELKSDLGADDFCLHQFYPTEPAFRSVLFVFNLLSWLQSLEPRPTQRRPATVRSTLFLCGAMAGRCGHKTVLFLSQSWGGLAARKSLLERILAAQNPTSPKFDSTRATAPPL